MPQQQFDERSGFVMYLQWLSTSTPGVWDASGPNPNNQYRIDDIMISNSDNIDHNVILDFLGGDGTTPACGVKVPARAGYDGSVAVDALALMRSTNNHYLILNYAQTIYANLVESITAGADVTMLVYCGLV